MSASSYRRPSSALRLAVALGVATAASAGLVIAITAIPQAQQPARTAQGYISGVVESAKGREAGVWVIAETTETPTRMIKSVVTADDGRFMLPELPNATFSVWVRGYGLVDSKPVPAKPGQTLTLKASLAATPAEAAKVYPANYWYSMLDVPPASEFPGKGADANGIPETFRSQAQFVDQLKQGCQLCHQLGNQLSRSLGHMKQLGFKSSIEAWDHRVKTGQRGSEMDNMMRRLGPRGLKMYADWTDRVAAGEVPPAPPRPSGTERNVVVTMWDWGNATSYMHDEITTSKQNPRVNANGPVWAVDAAHGRWIWVDPAENTSGQIDIPTRDDPKTMRSRFPRTMPKPSNFWGEEVVHAGVSDPHNPMMDNTGRLWATTTVSQTQPAWCRDGKLNKYAAYFPSTGSNRHASVYDPKTGKFELIYTCFGTHHLQFSDDNSMLYFSGGGATIPWVNVKVWDQTKDEQAATGWCPTVLDTNGDGRITKPWNEPMGGGRAQNEGGGGAALGKFDPKLDTRVSAGSYGIVVSPDNSVWASGTSYPGRFTRMEVGANPPETCKSELYTIPDDKALVHFGPRGIDVDRNGVVWASLSGSGGFVSFDRRKCRVLNGPTVAEGKHCPEGWAFYPLTKGPSIKGNPAINADFHYYNWVDQFNASGFGANTPIATGSGSDSLLALNPQTGAWTQLRVPYPLGFYSRGVDGRIDDPNAGWKGRALWANYGTNFLWHIEGGKGTTSKMVKFQVRPDPLAR
jgi:hypothetical protein